MTITSILEDIYGGVDLFTLPEAYASVEEKIEVKRPSIRARIYEAIDEGKLTRLAEGVFSFKGCLVIQGNGRDLSFIEDDSIDLIITDHPYDVASNKGGNRNFASQYDCFNYNQNDFNEMARVMKDGCFMLQFLPLENGDNWEYLYDIKKYAKNAGFEYYASVPWVKVGFVSNCGRTSKDSEIVTIFTKGKSRKLRPDAKKDKAEPNVKHFMAGASKMLPCRYEYAKPKNMIHQAEKPVELLCELLKTFSCENELVLDMFAGSGSLGEACILENRRAILIEKLKENINLITNRINNLVS